MNRHKYVGFDVHMATIVAVVLDQDGSTLSSSIIRTRTEEILGFVKGLGSHVHLALEVGLHSAWLSDLLSPHVEQLVVCDPTATAPRSKRSKNDRIDAARLASLLRNGDLRHVYQPERSARQLKELVRCYDALVSDTTRTRARLKAIFQGRGTRCAGRGLYAASSRDHFLALLEAEPGAQTRARVLFEQLDALVALRKQARLRMLAEARAHPAAKLLASVPGIGPVAVAQLIADVVTPFRFRSKRPFWSYCGLAVVVHTSAEYGSDLKRSKPWVATRGLNRDANRHLKRVFFTAALAASRRGPLVPYYQQQRARGLAESIARVALARKIAAITLRVWKSGEAFDVTKALATHST